MKVTNERIDMKKVIKLHSKVFIRTKTNGGKLSKQYFILAKCEGFDDTIIIDKNILTNDRFDHFENNGFSLKKEFKGYRLYNQRFSIKKSTLYRALKIMEG